jgi:DNA-3-methyladenine glycosylase II
MPSRFLHNETDLDAALAILTAGDVRLARLIEVAGRPALRRRPAGFPGLCAIICSQQLSTASAAIDLEALAGMEADEAHAALTALHGIGPWTADIYLLFCLGHADAWPAGDLALQEAARLAFALKRRPTSRDMVKLAEEWRPWRGVAAHMLWNYYRAIKRRDPVPAQAQIA